MKLTQLVLPLALTLSATAMASPTYEPNVVKGGNLWTITAHDDDSVSHTQFATQRICFMPFSTPATGRTQLRGRWYSTSYPNWHGHYRQEGDSVKMVGNFWAGKGNDAMSFDIVTSLLHTGLGDKHRTIGAGHWAEWGDDGRFGPVYGFGNALFQRIGACKSIKDFQELNIKPRLLKNGEEARFPNQPGQLPLEGFNEYEEPAK